MMLAEFLHLDSKALLAVLFWINLAAIAVNLAYWAAARRQIAFPELKLYTLSKICQAATFFLFLARSRLPDLLTVHLANSLFLIAMYAESLSVLNMLGQKTPRHANVLNLLLLAALAFFNIAEFVHSDPALRLVTVSIGVLVVLALPTAALLRGENGNAFKRILGAFYCAFGLLQAVRVWYALSEPGVGVFSSGVVHTLVYLSLICLNVASTSILFLFLMERRRAAHLAHQEELRAAMEKAQQASRLKTTFLASMSHEIRTPMNGIIGFAELAGDTPGLPRQTRDHIRKINASAQGLLQIINDILDISKIEAGKIDLESIPFSLHEVFLFCETVGMPRAREKGVTLFFYAEPPIRRKLLGDPTRLRQILVNLISNAIKFSNYGMVKVTALMEETGEDEAKLYFEVKDSGIGMSPEQQERIFQPFAQADESITRKYGGTGLGLAITKGLVERMGGELRVESKLGLGSRFSFRLRLKMSDVPDGEGDEAEEEVPGTIPQFSGDVLVCEDNAINQDVIVEHLSRLGLTVTVAPNGQVGVEAALARRGGKPFDLIFMDIHMPVMGGLEAAARLRDLGVGTPVVALTANVMSNNLEAYREHGMEECLAKPFRAAELWDCLRRYLRPEEELEAEAADAGTAAPDEGGVLDRKAGLSRAAGNTRLYARLLDTFRREQAAAGRDIGAALATGDAVLAHRIAHTLKSVSEMIGASRLSGAAREVEGAVTDGNADAARELLAPLDRELAAVLAALGGGERREPEKAAQPGGFDRTRAAALLDRLQPLLDEGNSACQEELAAVRSVLGPLGAKAAALAEQIEEFDFELASDTARELRAALPAE